MKYWLCINSEDSHEEVYPVIGSLFLSKKNENPPMINENYKWVEISKEEYEKAMENSDHIIKYDGYHCIGKCTECKEYINRKKICNETDEVIKNPNKFKNCCVFKD